MCLIVVLRTEWRCASTQQEDNDGEEGREEDGDDRKMSDRREEGKNLLEKA